MDYIIQYDISAMALLLLLAVLYFMRHNFPIITNKIYISMVVCNFIAAFSDIVSVYTIKNSEYIPLWVNYMINIIYLISYNSIAFLYYFYVLQLTKQNDEIRWFDRGICMATGVIDLSLILSTPKTGLIIYFDSEGKYHQGDLMMVLYLTALIQILYSAFLFIKNHERLTSFHKVSLTFFNITAIAAVIIQSKFPPHLIVNFVSSLFLLMVYISLQNPDDYIDKQTGCFNQTAFWETLNKGIIKKNKFTVIAFTLDGSKYINQMLGAKAVKKLENSVALYLQRDWLNCSSFHISDYNFALILDEKNLNQEDEIVASIQKHFSRAERIDSVEVLLTPYICIVHYPDFANTPEDINIAIEFAFSEMEKEKSKTVFVASSDSLERKKRESKIIHIMKSAIRNNSYDVYYQPLFNTATKKFSCAEALIRLWDDELGYISPDEFIPMAEKNGMIIEIGEIIFRTVCKFLKKNDIRKKGVEYIEVNLSTVQCMQEKLAQRMLDIMEEYSIAPNYINFEITETAGLINKDILRTNMDRLIYHGSTFSMDDYGTGFANANYLITLPTEIIKIDKSILWSAMQDQQAFTILTHTIKMLKALNKKIVVEGVETEEMATVLTNLGCDYLQGFLYSKAIPEDQFSEFIEKHN